MTIVLTFFLYIVLIAYSLQIKMFKKTTWITFKRSVENIIRHWNYLSRSQLHFSFANGFRSDPKIGQWLIGKGNPAKLAGSGSCTIYASGKSLAIVKVVKRYIVVEELSSGDIIQQNPQQFNKKKCPMSESGNGCLPYLIKKTFVFHIFSTWPFSKEHCFKRVKTQGEPVGLNNHK